MSLNQEVLRNIQNAESDHTLNILLVDHNMDIDLNSIIEVKNFGNLTVAVSTPLEASQLISRTTGSGISVVLTRRIPIKYYDVIITNEFTDMIKLIITNLKIKYLCFLNYVSNFTLTQYYEFAENSYRLTVAPERPTPPVIDDRVPAEEPANSQGDYDILVQEFATTPIKYDKYRINYLKPVCPGKVSIIMIVSALNNNFAEVIRDIKAQEIPLIEFIVVDNAAGFRNNVKPNIRYGTKMNEDFCIYHAKELASGEYMIILNESSQSFKVNDYLEQGNYETR